MADPRDKVAGSVPGRYYVDMQCIDCDVCRVTAPGNFERDEAKGFSFVSRQPETPEEETRCAEAMDCCPVEAIGSDGESLMEAEAEAEATAPHPESARK